MKLILSRLLSVMYINEVSYFAVLSDRCLVDIYSASQYFHYFGKIVFSTDVRRRSMNCYWKNQYFDKSGANKFCSNNNLILYIGKMSLYEDIYIMGHYQIKRTFTCSYFGDIKYFRSRFALAY